MLLAVAGVGIGRFGILVSQTSAWLRQTFFPAILARRTATGAAKSTTHSSPGSVPMGEDR